MSRLHCRLTAGAAELEVIDLESTNGTFVNGERIDRATLKGGDRLGVGSGRADDREIRLENGFVRRSRPMVVGSP